MYRHHEVYEALFCQTLVGEKVCLMRRLEETHNERTP